MKIFWGAGTQTVIVALRVDGTSHNFGTETFWHKVVMWGVFSKYILATFYIRKGSQISQIPKVAIADWSRKVLPSWVAKNVAKIFLKIKAKVTFLLKIDKISDVAFGYFNENRA